MEKPGNRIPSPRSVSACQSMMAKFSMQCPKKALVSDVGDFGDGWRGFWRFLQEMYGEIPSCT